MKYLSATEILIIHSEIIDATGGSHGVRDAHLLGSILEKPKSSFGGVNFYPDVFSKAAAYAESFAKYHVFIDGNKRTAFAASVRFLEINGFSFNATNDTIEKFFVRIVEEKLETPAISAWLKKHSRKLQVK